MIFCIKGATASGKSTRTKYLIDFLRSSGIKETALVFEKKIVGFYFESLNFAIIGKYYKKNGVERFQGYDSMTGSLTASKLGDFLRSNNDINFLIEGSGITATFRLRPKFLIEELGFSKIVIIYFNFSTEQKDEYIKRVFIREGKYPLKFSGWNKHKGFLSDYLKSVEELKFLPEKSVDLYYREFSECIDFVQLIILSELNYKGINKIRG